MSANTVLLFFHLKHLKENNKTRGLTIYLVNPLLRHLAANSQAKMRHIFCVRQGMKIP
jgi:hypothetical protein